MKPEILSARREGLDRGQGYTEWYACCTKHGTLEGHKLKREAKQTLDTTEFCEDCRKEGSPG